MKRYYALSAIGKDRPGIVAEVSGLIYECGGNLEDSSMTRLGEQFALLFFGGSDQAKYLDFQRNGLETQPFFGLNLHFWA